MSSNVPEESSQTRPEQLRAPHSLSHIENSPPGPFPRLRAKTVPAAVAVTTDDPETPLIPSSHEVTDDGTDVFDQRDSALPDETNDAPADSAIHDLPEQFGELPIELISLTDR